MSNANICLELGISEEFLDAICHHNGIDRKQGWSESEKQVLRDYFYDKPLSFIQDELLKVSDRSRTELAIKHKAHELGLKRLKKRRKNKVSVHV